MTSLPPATATDTPAATQPHSDTGTGIRHHIEQQECQLLHPLAAKSANSGPRAHPDTPCDLRTAFQRDRDRIIHSKAFRRLSHKTQVFISPKGDHYRTRLTHSLEVAQVSRTIARALRLNEDLSESIALSHDLGHPPFGHAGEHVLNDLFAHTVPGGFHHQHQSLRIVQHIEHLNLTPEVLNGIEGGPNFLTLESRIVDLADRIAYLHHDVEDAQRAGLMQEADLPREIVDILGINRGQRLDRMVLDVIRQSEQAMEAADNPQAPAIRMSPDIFEAMFALRQWMFEHIYLRPEQVIENEKVKTILEGLYTHLMAHPELVFRTHAAHAHKTDADALSAKAQRVLDYIAGMTDRYAIDLFKALLLPHPYASGFYFGGGQRR